MRVPRKLGSFFAALACLNLFVPLQLLDAANPPQVVAAGVLSSQVAKPVTSDVTLDPTNGLHGTLVDESGVGLANRIVVAVRSDKSILQAVSNADGEFRFPGAKPGLYQIASDGGYQACRCWEASSAPPVAAPGLLLVAGEQTLRGQRPIGEILSGPVLIGLIIAAAIIIPIAVHNSKKSAS